MHNTWIIVKHEYIQRVRQRSFLFATLGIPLLMLIVVGASIFFATSSQKGKPLGYVDLAGVLAPGIRPEVQGDTPAVVFHAYPDEASAHLALEQGEIQAYYVIPSDYLQSHRLDLSYLSDPPQTEVRNQFDNFIRVNLTANLPAQVQTRLIETPTITVQSLDGSREISSANVWGVVLPFLAAFLFFFTVMFSAGYLLQVVADEKENRTIEILITSLSPEQIISGKSLGLMGVGLTQMLIWLFAIIIGLVIGAQFNDIIRTIQIPWSLIGIAVIYFLPAYALIAGFMTAIGGAVTDTRQGQQIGGILNILFILPMILSSLVFTNPNSPLLVFFTLFPTTSFVTVMLRWGTASIPIWQLAISWILLVLSAILAVWASARIFRAGMLRYGKGLDLRGAWAAVRARES